MDSDRMESERISNSSNAESDGTESDRMESDKMSISSNLESDRMDSDRKESDRMSNSANPESLALRHGGRKRVGQGGLLGH
jgi:hypothetical protein